MRQEIHEALPQLSDDALNWLVAYIELEILKAERKQIDADYASIRDTLNIKEG